jgi:hypothetical protein
MMGMGSCAPPPPPPRPPPQQQQHQQIFSPATTTKNLASFTAAALAQQQFSSYLPLPTAPTTATFYPPNNNQKIQLLQMMGDPPEKTPAENDVPSAASVDLGDQLCVCRKSRILCVDKKVVVIHMWPSFFLFIDSAVRKKPPETVVLFPQKTDIGF